MAEEEFVAGIFNYCDRWCERCNFTDQCRLYHNDQSKNKDAGEDDFAHVISKSLSETIELLHNIAEERGINLDDLEDDDESFYKEQAKHEAARNHPITLASDEYLKQTDQWMKAFNSLEKEMKELIKNIELGIQPHENDKKMRIIQEALSIIGWYVFQISVKITTALNYFPHDPSFENEIQNMHHASAKIALIGIENSMKAWQSLQEVGIGHEDFILDRLLQLERIKASIYKRFPLITQYRRPYFND